MAHRGETALKVLILVAFAIGVSGCLDRARFNVTCSWAAPTAAPLDLTIGAQRRHLRDDALLAEALGIRLGDSLRGIEPIDERRRRWTACTDSLFPVIAQAHHVSLADLISARDRRDTWIDLLVVLLPLGVLYAFGARYAVDSVRRSYRDYGAPTTAVMTVPASLVVALLALMVGNQRAWIVEGVRLGDDHISFRAERLPWRPYAVQLFVGALLLFWLIAWRRWRRAL